MNNTIDKNAEGVEEWVPLSMREARMARVRLRNLWPYVWMNFVSMILLFAAAVVMAYRMASSYRATLR